MTEQRKELAYEKHDLPSRFWEPEPDEEDLERMRKEWIAQHKDDPDEELPFN